MLHNFKNLIYKVISLTMPKKFVLATLLPQLPVNNLYLVVVIHFISH